MPNYIISYTINDKKIRNDFSTFLNELGLTNELDQFTRFGLYDNNKETIVKILIAAKRKYGIDKNDTIVLYYADLNRNNYSTIKTITI